MIFYMPVPIDCLAYEQNNEGTITLKLPSGGLINAVSDEFNQLRVISISSTDPRDYLNSKYQPGTIISMQPDWQNET